MTNKTEHEFDLENLEQLQKAGKIDQEVDLDKLVKNKWTIVRLTIAWRDRDQDLDILVEVKNNFKKKIPLTAS